MTEEELEKAMTDIHKRQFLGVIIVVICVIIIVGTLIFLKL